MQVLCWLSCVYWSCRHGATCPLPTYTSDIVNVGIQQGGVDESVPEQIAGDELERLLLFVPSDEQDTVREAYEEAKAGEYDYDGTVLELKETVKRQHRGAG